MARHTPRLYVDATLAPGKTVELGAAKRHHIVNVLRLAPGEALHVFNNSGCEYSARLGLASRKRAVLEIEAVTEPPRESALAVTLIQSVARGDRLDYALAKAVELGVARVQPVFAERGQVQLTGERLTKKHGHWQAVVEAAAEQSGRLLRPLVAPPTSLGDALAAPFAGARLMLSPEAGQDLAAVAPLRRAALVVGPESGFSTRELEAAEAAGWQLIGLGPRVLRTETAGPAALAAIQTLWGDLAGAPGSLTINSDNTRAAGP